MRVGWAGFSCPQQVFLEPTHQHFPKHVACHTFVGFAGTSTPIPPPSPAQQRGCKYGKLNAAAASVQVMHCAAKGDKLSRLADGCPLHTNQSCHAPRRGRACRASGSRGGRSRLPPSRAPAAGLHPPTSLRSITKQRPFPAGMQAAPTHEAMRCSQVRRVLARRPRVHERRGEGGALGPQARSQLPPCSHTQQCTALAQAGCAAALRPWQAGASTPTAAPGCCAAHAGGGLALLLPAPDCSIFSAKRRSSSGGTASARTCRFSSSPPNTYPALGAAAGQGASVYWGLGACGCVLAATAARGPGAGAPDTMAVNPSPSKGASGCRARQAHAHLPYRNSSSRHTSVSATSPASWNRRRHCPSSSLSPASRATEKGRSGALSEPGWAARALGQACGGASQRRCSRCAHPPPGGSCRASPQSGARC